MASMIDICNEALGYIGFDNISDIDDTSEVKAIRCKQFFWPTAEALLRMHDWNFATTRVALALLSTTPAFGYDYEYHKPELCLKVQGVATSASDLDSEDITTTVICYKVEGDKILSSEADLLCKYTKFVKEVGKWDSLFCQAMAPLLASKLAMGLKQSQSEAQAMLKLFFAFLTDAKGIDAKEMGTVPVRKQSSWLDAR